MPNFLELEKDEMAGQKIRLLQFWYGFASGATELAPRRNFLAKGVEGKLNHLLSAH